MKFRSLNELKQDKNITPEDVAQFALFERNLNDSDKFKAICDLILCCEKVSTLKLEARNKKLEALVKELIPIAKDGYRLHIKNACHQDFLEEDEELLSKAEQALNNSK